MDGELTTDGLAEVTRRAGAVKARRDEYARDVAALREAIVSADQAGHGRNAIVRAAGGGLSRAKVFEALGAADLLEGTCNALAAAGLPVTSGDQVRHVMVAEHAGRVQIFVRWGEEPRQAVSDQRDKALAREAAAVLEAAGYTVSGDPAAGWSQVTRAAVAANGKRGS